MTTQPLSVTVLVDPSIQRGGRFIDQFVSADPDSRVLAIVPKRGNRGGRRRKRPGVLLTTEQLAQLGSGCSCCTVRTDIRSKIRRIAAENSADQVVIQMGPSSDLVTLAKSFTVADHNGVSLLDVAQLQSMVVVVDAQTAMEQLQSGDAWGLLQQIGMANVVWVDGAANIEPEAASSLEELIATVNPDAQMVRDSEHEVSIEAVRALHPFDLDSAQRRSTPEGLIDGPPTAPGATVARYLFQARKPFHPGRLHAFMGRGNPSVLLASGLFWVASRSNTVAALDVSGSRWQSRTAGAWWANVPVARRPKSAQFQSYLSSIWDPTYGDRRQSLGFLGLGLDTAALQSDLDACLLTDAELADQDAWAS
ncbi:MAG TPA: hypothetical protein DFR83_04420, partial [Deltaproteobacteria bacterium]|nr:hypothetical protein [Deltaproteobacteria bacterium]